MFRFAKKLLALRKLESAFKKANWKETPMSGWKTWVGVAVMAGSAALNFLGHTELADSFLRVAAVFGLVGLGHKIDKARK